MITLMWIQNGITLDGEFNQPIFKERFEPCRESGLVISPQKGFRHRRKLRKCI